MSGNLFPVPPSTLTAASPAPGYGAEDRTVSIRAESMARKGLRQRRTCREDAGLLQILWTTPEMSGYLAARAWTLPAPLACSTTSGCTTLPAASGPGSPERIVLIKTVLTERKAQAPQEMFRVAAKLASFGLILREMSGSLADSALTRPAPELPRVPFSTICGNSRAASGFGSRAEIRQIRTASLAPRRQRRQGMFRGRGGDQWVGRMLPITCGSSAAGDTAPKSRNRPDSLTIFGNTSRAADSGFGGRAPATSTKTARILPTAYRL